MGSGRYSSWPVSSQTVAPVRPARLRNKPLEPPRPDGDDEPRVRAEGDRRPRDTRVLSGDVVADRTGRPAGAAGQGGRRPPSVRPGREGGAAGVLRARARVRHSGRRRTFVPELRAWLVASLGWPEAELGTRFTAGVRHLIEPARWSTTRRRARSCAPAADVDLTELPLPLLAEKDGGPYISAGVVLAKSAERRLNGGCYRLMYRCRDETGIDLVTVSDLRRLYEGAFARREPLPISARGRASPRDPERGVQGAAGGERDGDRRGAARRARASQSGRDDRRPRPRGCGDRAGRRAPRRSGGRRTRGPSGNSPACTATSRPIRSSRSRRSPGGATPCSSSSRCPGNAWLGAAATEAQVWNVLKTAGVDVVRVAVTEGSACRWSAIASIASERAAARTR